MKDRITLGTKRDTETGQPVWRIQDGKRTHWIAPIILDGTSNYKRVQVECTPTSEWSTIYSITWPDSEDGIPDHPETICGTWTFRTLPEALQQYAELIETLERDYS